MTPGRRARAPVVKAGRTGATVGAGAAPWTLLACLAVPCIAWAIGPQRFLLGLTVALQVLFCTFLLRHCAFAVSAMRAAPVDLRTPRVADPSFLPSVSVMVACKNEEAVLPALVGSLLELDYPRDRLELILVDDGSTDRTGALLDEYARRHPHLRCVHRPRRATPGKSAALNAAVRIAIGQIFVVFDADHQPRPDVVRRLVSHFCDPRVGAVQGRCEIRNPGDSLLARLIALDYFAGYLVNEYGRQSLFRLPAYGGANSAVRASSLRALGGWNEDSVTEDTDLTLRLLLRGEHIRYDVNAVDREEGVVTLARFWRQRYRWARGHQQVFRDYWRHVWSSPRLSRWQKVETMMFLFVFHVPVASALGLVVFAVATAQGSSPAGPFPVSVFWTLLFLGPLLELGAGLLVAEADRREALVLAFFLPLFLVSMALCAKAWIDAALGRPYGWAKTARAADGIPVAVPG